MEAKMESNGLMSARPGGTAVGTQPGNAGGDAQHADSTAVFTGNWGPNQTVSAAVYRNNPSDGYAIEEVELRLRTSITPKLHNWI